LHLGFNPLTDTLINEDGEEVMLRRQQEMNCLKNGFDAEDKGFWLLMVQGIQVTVSETSERLQLLVRLLHGTGY
jgi:aconitate hydratase